jgi:hypothetical protein
MFSFILSIDSLPKEKATGHTAAAPYIPWSYEKELGVQRLERALLNPRWLRETTTARVVDGGCVVLGHPRFSKKKRRPRIAGRRK